MRYAPIVLLISTGCAAIASAAPVSLPPLPPPSNDLPVGEQRESSTNRSDNPDPPNDLAVRDQSSANQPGRIAPRTANPTMLITFGVVGGCLLILFGAGTRWLFLSEKKKREDELHATVVAQAAAIENLGGTSPLQRVVVDSAPDNPHEPGGVGTLVAPTTPSRRRGSLSGQSTRSAASRSVSSIGSINGPIAHPHPRINDHPGTKLPAIQSYVGLSAISTSGVAGVGVGGGAGAGAGGGARL